MPPHSHRQISKRLRDRARAIAYYGARVLAVANPAVAASEPIQYDFVLDGGRTNQLLYLTNNTNAPLTLKNIRITTNAYIQSPWQALAQYWSDVVITQDSDSYIYTLNLPTPIQLQPGANKIAEYSVSGANLGPLPEIALPPKKVEVQCGNDAALKAVNITNPNPAANPHPNSELLIYNAEWGPYAYQKDAANEDYSSLNSIAYAFIGFDEDGNLKSLDPWADSLQLVELALEIKRRPYLKTSLSFGGWTNNGQMMDAVFSKMAANEEARKKFIAQVVRAVAQTGVNGVDIDWEYVKPKDAKNYIDLLEGLRDALPKEVRITIAAPGGIDKIKYLDKTQWESVYKNVTGSMMAYDYFGAPFSEIGDFHTAWNLSSNSPNKDSGYDIQTAIDTGKKLNIPLNQQRLGIPNYSRSFIVENAGDFAGMYQPIVAAPMGDFPDSNGVYSWNSISNFLNGKSSPIDNLKAANWKFYDTNHEFCKDAKMCFLSGTMPDGKTVVINFLDPAAARERAEEAVRLGFAGVMEWANHFDDAENSFAKAISQGMDDAKKPRPTVKADVESERTDLEKQIFPYLEKLRTDFSWSSMQKQALLSQMLRANSLKEARDVFNTNEAELKKHFNPIKRWLMNILPNSLGEYLFAPEKSFFIGRAIIADRVKKTEPTRYIIRPPIPSAPKLENNEIEQPAKQVNHTPQPPANPCPFPPSYTATTMMRHGTIGSSVSPKAPEEPFPFAEGYVKTLAKNGIFPLPNNEFGPKPPQEPYPYSNISTPLPGLY